MPLTYNSETPLQSYQSKTVWMSSGDYASNQTISGSLTQLSRIQSVDWSVSYDLSESAYVNGGVESFYPKPNGVDVNYNWLHTNLANEKAIGLIRPSVDPNFSILDSQDEKNAYIAIENFRGIDYIGTPTGLSQSVLGLAQGAITSYGLSASVGGFVEANANINYLNAEYYNKAYATIVQTGEISIFNFFSEYYLITFDLTLLKIETGYAHYYYGGYTISSGLTSPSGPFPPNTNYCLIAGQTLGYDTPLNFNYPVGTQFGVVVRVVALGNGIGAWTYTAGEEFYGDFTVPSVDYKYGEQLTGKFIIPVASMQYDRNSSSIYENVSALGAQDIKMTFTKKNPFAIAYTGNEHCYLNGFNMNLAFNRIEQKPLGYVYPTARAVMYPVLVDVTTEATVSRYQAEKLRVGSCDTGIAIQIETKHPCTRETLSLFSFEDLKAESHSVTASIDGYDTVTTKWKGYIKNPQDIVISGFAG